MADVPFFLEPVFGDDGEPEDNGDSFSYEEGQEYLYDIIGFTDASFDETAHNLFYDAMYNDALTIDERIQMFEDLQDYLYEEYDIDFAEYWDWDDFREWYAAQ